MLRLALLLLLLAAVPAQAERGGNGHGEGRDRDRDHDRARAAREAGEVLSLSDILARVRDARPGRVIELDLDRENGRWIYGLELISPDGQLHELAVDAATGAILDIGRTEAGD